MSKYIYLALFVDQKDLFPKIRAMFPEGLENEMRDHPHITLAFRPTKFHETLFGEKVEIAITGYGKNATNEGVSVKVRSFRNHKLRRLIAMKPRHHITLSISPGAQAVNTGSLCYDPLAEPFEVTGVFGAYGADGRIYVGHQEVQIGPPVADRNHRTPNCRLYGTVNGRTIYAPSLTGLKNIASRAANLHNPNNLTDHMTVTLECENGVSHQFEYVRKNRKVGGTIRKGTWQ